MEVRGFAKSSSTVIVVLDKTEFDSFRELLLELKDKFSPGDGTCNAYAYEVVSEICQKSFDDNMRGRRMLYPGEVKKDTISLVLTSHRYVAFQELLENWMKASPCVEITKSKLDAVAVVSGICKKTWAQVMEEMKK